ncbi:MAG: hypothetical protein HY894_03685 [Deltaproteobacteria bacterium]|nr:hypothetical protein [Deltaproteobacteria bacterium]
MPFQPDPQNLSGANAVPPAQGRGNASAAPDKKGLILAAASIAASVAAWWWIWRLISLFFADRLPNDAYVIIYPVACLEAAIAIFVITALLVKEGWIVLIASVIWGIIPFVFSPAAGYARMAVVATVFFTVYAAFRVRGEMGLIIRPSLWRLFKAGAPGFFTAASIVIAFYSAASYRPGADIAGTFIPKPVFDVMLKEITGTVSPRFALPMRLRPSDDKTTDVTVVVPRGNETVDEYLKTVAIEQMSTLQPEERAMAEANLDAVAAGLRDELSRRAGMPLTGRERLGDVIYGIFAARAEAALAPYKESLPIVIGALAFVTAKSLSILAYYPTLFLTFILIKAGQWMKIWKMEKKEAAVERFTL